MLRLYNGHHIVGPDAYYNDGSAPCIRYTKIGEAPPYLVGSQTDVMNTEVRRRAHYTGKLKPFFIIQGRGVWVYRTARAAKRRFAMLCNRAKEASHAPQRSKLLDRGRN